MRAKSIGMRTIGLVALALVMRSAGLSMAQPVAEGARPAREWRKAARERQRRIIFNNDGNDATREAKAPTVQALLEARTRALMGSQVDSIFYCTGGAFSMFNHATKVGQGDAERHARAGFNQLKGLLDAGVDPLRAMVDFGKQQHIEVFWSMRMNDVHDSGSRPEYVAWFDSNRVKTQHPEYLLGARGKKQKQGGWSAVNYARPEVRELAYQYIEEVCTNYDVDGVELDFFRHPVFFKATTQEQPVGDEERAMMTELMTRVRQLTDEVGRKRGRPILIAMRVPDSVEYCRAIGLDLEKWLAGDLLDLLVVSSYFQLNEWEYSVALGHKYGVKVYPSLDESRVADEAARTMRVSSLAYRGRAADVWAAGADGVYRFNAFDPQNPLWREMGDPKVLAKLDCDYFGSTRGSVRANGGNLPIGPYQKIETLNPANPKVVRPGKSQTAKLRAGAGFKPGEKVQLTLRLQLDRPVEPGAVEVTLNGQAVKLEPAEKRWLRGPVGTEQVQAGINTVTLKAHSVVSKPLKWQDLVLEVRH